MFRLNLIKKCTVTIKMAIRQDIVREKGPYMVVFLIDSKLINF